MEPSPALSLLAKAQLTLAGRKPGILVSEDRDGARVEKLRRRKALRSISIIAPRIAGVKTRQGDMLAADHAIAGAPSVLFDTVAVLVSGAGADTLCRDPNAINFIRDAYTHLKHIGRTLAAAPLFEKAGVADDEAIVDIASGKGMTAFIEGAKNGRYWERADKG